LMMPELVKLAPEPDWLMVRSPPARLMVPALVCWAEALARVRGELMVRVPPAWLTSGAARVRPPSAPAEAVIAAPAALVRVPEVTASVVLTLLLPAVIRSRVPLLVNPAATVNAALPKEPSPCTRRREPAAVVRAPLMTVVPSAVSVP